MPNATLILISLLALGFTLATWLQPWHANWEGDRRRDQGVLALFLGDGRRVFGEYFFRKADVYFHSGVYPSMFDQAAAHEENHMAEATSAPTDDHEDEDAHEHDHDHDHDEGHDHDHDHAELPPRNDAPVDWLDRLSRSFYPTRHVHLEEARAREILPWIRISAELDPQNVATYTTAAFWLRRQLGKPDEAEKFLREGLRANPGNPEILFELGRLFDEDHGDTDRARNLYELALRQWEAKPESEKEDIIMFRQVMAHLAWLEERENRLPQAIDYWQRLASRLEDPTTIQQRIAELQLRLNPPAPPAAP
jgi:tetratricopeptide (TPR) repeat protein